MRLVLKLDDQVVQEYVFNKKDVTIGRTTENDISIENEAVSGRHATLHQAESGSTILSDMNSSNGVLVNDKRVTRHKLDDGDVITISPHQLVFHTEVASNDSPSEQSEATVIVSADFQKQLQEELNKKKATAVITRRKEKNLLEKIKQFLGL